MADDSFPIDVNAVRSLLGFRRPVPVTPTQMVRNLKVVFVPATRVSPRLQAFGEKLRGAFRALGVREIPLQEALNSVGQLVEGVIPLFLGDPQIDVLTLEQLPLQDLYSSQMVGIFDRKSPVDEASDLQTRLDSIVEVMTTHLVTVCVFVTDEQWVMCTMNGAVAVYDNVDSITADVARGLIPKIAARVTPPRVSDITCRYETFDPSATEYAEIVQDFLTSIRIWEKSGFLAAHTSVDRLKFRNPMHRMIVTSYLDDRSGMSYGFLAWQIPTACEPAVPLKQFRGSFGSDLVAVWESQRWVRVQLDDDYAVPVPEVSVICTRSGCRKDQLDPKRDLVKLTLSNGKVILDTAPGISQAEDCRPSYDTFTILGSALGNCLAASILKAVQPDAPFPRALQTKGLSLSHWHGYLSEQQVAPELIRHGADNPGVCCSTPQSAIYALTGKLRALDQALQNCSTFMGDVHIEPHHGTNLCGILSLSDGARMVHQTVQ